MLTLPSFLAACTRGHAATAPALAAQRDRPRHAGPSYLDPYLSPYLDPYLSPYLGPYLGPNLIDAIDLQVG